MNCAMTALEITLSAPREATRLALIVMVSLPPEREARAGLRFPGDVRGEAGCARWEEIFWP
ncbi:hypothetical protein AA0535_0032 [Asaia krungthepensis NRIC 0535]|uniref:Uncharacterized protein n=1 Tax=Asaia krungthepensis NRIC 0535 TaxID=1307925 RepID=A0ABQ0PVG9_9PROT|nr:hypothetical protein AA0535_0032 [Asaia krungthepensis NRIC 0535]